MAHDDFAAEVSPSGDVSAREAALRDVLNVISLSRDDDKPVFAAILEKASALCGATTAGLALVNPAERTLAFEHMVGRPVLSFMPGQSAWSIDGPQAISRAVSTRRVVHEEDFADSELYRSGDPTRRALVDQAGIRSVVAVPLLLGDMAIGVIAAHRHDDAPKFTPSDIDLLQTFAAQAVIAIENARQFREVQTRLQREQASAEILQVISQSREDEKPVFGAILKNACALCDAPLAGLILGTPDDAVQELAAHQGMFAEAVHLFDSGQMVMDGDLSYAAKSIVEGKLITFTDMGESDLYKAGSPIVRSMVDASNIRSVMFVPLLRHGVAIGNITVFRREVRGFDPSEIALIETFAAQAVIAIENVRQFQEVQARLEREAATKQVLEVISQSRDDDVPVFKAILKKAERLCNADASGLQLVTQDRTHLRMVLGSGRDRGSFQPGYLFDLSEPLGMCTAVREARVVHKKDLKGGELYKQGHPGRRKLVDEEGVLTQVAVPLIKNDVVIGTMTLSRLVQKPFSNDEIALVETFAAQAVIAIENVHQFQELQMRLERETATKEILGVISQSRDSEDPVF